MTAERSPMIIIVGFIAIMAGVAMPAAALQSASSYLTTSSMTGQGDIIDFINSISANVGAVQQHARRLSHLPGDQYVEEFFSILKDQRMENVDRERASRTGNRTETDGHEIDQFIRSLQQQPQRTGGGFGTKGSYLDGKLRGSGLFDNSQQQKGNNDNEYIRDNHNDMALPRSHARSRPGQLDSESTIQSYGSDEKDSRKDVPYGKKGSKSSNGYEKKQKKSKREKGSKKKIDKKLAVDGYFDDWIEPYEDDDNVAGDDWRFDEWEWEIEEENELLPTEGLTQSLPAEPTMSPAPTVTPYPTGTGYTEDEMLVLGRAGMQSRFDGDSLSQLEEVQKEEEEEQGIKLSFPTIQHMIYSGSIHLKAHSVQDLSELDPEIFAILQSQLTPYLQDVVGHTLQAYTLEVDYTPGFTNDQSLVSPGIVVTNMEVTCTLKVRSDSVVTLKRITHQQVNKWIRDFFGGSYLTQFLTELQNNNIHANEIVFVEDTFKTNGQVIASIASGGNPSSSSPPSDSGSNTGMMIGVTIAIIAVGGVLFLHLTGNLPSREELGDFRTSLLSKLHLDSGSDGGSKDEEDATGLEGLGRRPSRQRPSAEIRRAAIQKKPAYSDDYLSVGSKSNASKRSSSSGVRTSSNPSSSPKSIYTPIGSRNAGFDDYSFSGAEDYNIGGDYDAAVRSHQSPSRSWRRGDSPKTNTSHTRDDEFSMPADYDTVVEGEGDAESLYSKWSQSVMTFMPGRKNQKKTMTGPPPGSPRRVTPADLGARTAARGDAAMDAWSVGSFDTKSPSTSGVYRDWSVKSPTSRSSSKRTKLAMPNFT